MSVKRAVLGAAEKFGIAAAARRLTAGKLRILCYHGVWVTPGYEYGDCTFMAPEQFERRMARLKRSGLPVLPLGDAVRRLGDGTLPDAAVVITIDDGWVSTLTHMLPVLEAYDLPATLYATTWYAGRPLPVVNMVVDYFRAASGRTDLDVAATTARIEALPVDDRMGPLRRLGADLGIDESWLQARQFNIMSAEEFAEAQRRGLDVQLHTHRHINVTRQVDALAAEVEENRAFLRNALGELPFAHFCYPSGTFHPRAKTLLAESGVTSATLVDEGLNGRGADPLALRRFLDGRRVSDVEFDAYLSGMLECIAPLRALVPGARVTGG